MADARDTQGYREASGEDLNLYFSSTFLKMKEGATDYGYCFIEAVIGNGSDKVVIFRKPGSSRGIERNLRSLDVDFTFPTVGVYNYLKTVVHAQRKTARQNKKGLCSGTFNVSPVHERFSQFGRVPDMFRMKNGWGWTGVNVANTFGTPSYMSLDKAHKAVVGCSAFARAVSPEFYLAQGICSEAPSLWYRGTFVGNVTNPKAIEVIDPMFAQEVIDQFRKEGVTVNV